MQRAELTERIRKRTMDLAWAMTARDIEATARAVVDAILGRGFVSGVWPRTSEAAEVLHSEAPGQWAETAEFHARGDALLVVGEIFSGEKAQHLREGLNKLATRDAREDAGDVDGAEPSLGGLSSLSLRPRDETAASTSTTTTRPRRRRQSRRRRWARSSARLLALEGELTTRTHAAYSS